MQKLINVQMALQAPKGQHNNFGNYDYRSAEDILNAVKPLLQHECLTMTITDELVNIGDRYYIKSTVTVKDSDTKEVEITTAYAREALDKKGMDVAQITGAASSYARKYALNGMFLIDDVKDDDTRSNTDKIKDNFNGVTMATKKETDDFIIFADGHQLNKEWKAKIDAVRSGNHKLTIGNIAESRDIIGKNYKLVGQS